MVAGESDIVHEVRHLDGSVVSLRYRAVRDSDGPGRSSRIVDVFGIDDLLNLVGASANDREGFERPERLFWFANGFQSWSPGWEIQGLGRHRRLRVLRILDRYIMQDRQRIGRGEMAAHGFAYLRVGERYLALLSRNRGGPPVTFRINRSAMRVSIELYSDGALFRAGEPVAEVLCLFAEGYFAFKDQVKGLFADLAGMPRADSFTGTARGGGQSVVQGWCSWYRHYGKIDEETIRYDLEGMADTQNAVNMLAAARGRPAVFQIDDGWQRAIGDWEPHPERFPGGMKRLASEAAARGYVPGLWVAPFAVSPGARVFRDHPEWLLHLANGRLARAGFNPGWGGIFYCLDLSMSEVRGYLQEVFRRIIDEWGFRYLKLDFLYAGMLSGRHAAEGGTYRWYREALDPIVSITRSRNADPVVFLGCGAPLESSVSLFPLMRVGADTRPSWDDRLLAAIGYTGRPSALINLRDSIGRAFMNRSLYYADPDVVFLRSKRCSLLRGEKELIAAVAIMFGSQMMTSDDYRDSAQGEEAELAEWMVAFSDLIGNREFGAVMIAPDLWRCFSRDGGIGGVINLRRRAANIGPEDCSRFNLIGERILPTGGVRATGDSGLSADQGTGAGLRIAPHSISLWRRR